MLPRRASLVAVLSLAALLVLGLATLRKSSRSAPSSTASAASLASSPASLPPQSSSPSVPVATASSPDDLWREIQTLAQSDPAAAIDRAHRLGRTDDEKNTWVAELARQWTQRDPDAAWLWLARQTQDRLRLLATGTLPAVIIDTLARHNPALLVHKVDALVRIGETALGVAPVIAVHLGLESLVATGQLDRALLAVEAWVGDPRPLTIGEAAYAAVADALRASNPDAAGRWLTSLPRSAAHDIALVEFPARWSASDPHAALAWTETHVPPDLRAQAVQRAFGDWAERTPLAAAEWLGDYLQRTPADSATDRLIGALVNLGPALQKNPALALQWTNLISDSATRARQEERVVIQWATHDPAAARDYLWRTSSLAPERKSALAQQIHFDKPPATD